MPHFIAKIKMDESHYGNSYPQPHREYVKNVDEEEAIEDSFDEQTKLSKRGIELNNGRAAMMGILGLMVHEQLGGELPLVGQM